MTIVHLPIAEISVDAILLLLLGGGVGFLSGMFGLGGGFLTTPLLILMGIPPAVAVASSANQMIGASTSAGLVHMKKGNVDKHIGGVIIAGGLGGSVLGVWLFSLLRQSGHIDNVISLTFVILLSVVGSTMAWESLKVIFRKKKATRPSRLLPLQWLHPLPFKVRFRASRIYISFLLPLILGMIVGIFSAVLGIGGGLLLVPAMIYLLRIRTLMVVGTSLLYTTSVAMGVTILHAVTNHTVDIMLAFLLIVGSILGAQGGSRLSSVMRAEYLRMIMAMLVLLVAGKLIHDLIDPPMIMSLYHHYTMGELSSPLNEFLRHLAMDHAFIYGILAVGMAFLLGLLAAQLRPRKMRPRKKRFFPS